MHQHRNLKACLSLNYYIPFKLLKLISMSVVFNTTWLTYFFSFMLGWSSANGQTTRNKVILNINHDKCWYRPQNLKWLDENRLGHINQLHYPYFSRFAPVTPTPVPSVWLQHLKWQHYLWTISRIFQIVLCGLKHLAIICTNFDMKV